MDTNTKVQSLLSKCKDYCTKQETIVNIQDLLSTLSEGQNVSDRNVSRRLVELIRDIVKHENSVAGDFGSCKCRQLALYNTHVITFVMRILSVSFAPDVAAEIFQALLCAPEENDINDPQNIPPREPLRVLCPSIYHHNLTANVLVKGMDLHFLTSPNVEGESLILELLDVVVKLCLELKIPRFQAITGLLMWLDTVERVFKEGLKVSNECIFVPGTKEVDAITMVVAANWESPVNGVSDLVKKVYGVLLRLHDMEKQHLSVTNSMDLHRFLLEKTMRMPWTAKPKFQCLACLLQYVDFTKCIAMDLKLPEEVIGCLSSTHLTSVAADVYKSSITKRNKDIDKDAWAKYWKTVIARATLSDNRVQRHNLTTHILPWTLQNVPDSFEDLCEALKADKNLNLTSLVTLFRIAKQAGVLLSSSEGKELIHDCLHHKSNEVRAQVFGLLCSCHAKSQLPTAEEFESILSFLLENLNVDDAWFRTEITVHMENLVIRLRDRALTLFSRTRRQGMGTLEMDGSFLKIVGFIEGLVSLCIQNLYLGAGYQRTITCITVLETVFGTFSYEPKGKRKMNQRKDGLRIMLDYLHEANTRLNPATGATHKAVMQCIFHGADDVRQVAFKILSTCVMKNSQSGYITDVIGLAKLYMSSPKAHDTAIGATLMHLYLFSVKDDSKALEDGIATLCKIVRRESENVRNDFVEASQSTPAHGGVLALATCFSDLAILMALKAAGCLDTYALNAVELAGHLISDALKIMRLEDITSDNKAENSTNNDSMSKITAAPSFEDTNRAFLQLIRDWEGVHGEISDKKRQILLEKMNSCSWLCIKNSCKLLEEVTRACYEDNGISISFSYETIKEIDRKFVDVLFECRHRGAIESCYESYRAFCRLITLSTNTKIAGLPFENLRQLLLQVVKKTKSASVTRRSAGLPLLKRALVESRPDNPQHPLVAYTVDELEKAARSPLSEATSVEQEVDLIQAEALHILCGLVGAASLSSAMLPHLGRILRLTVDMLSAPRWVIVNAAHQLYGAVMPRLLGQKKTKEIVGHNTMTAAELFTFYPDLRSQFLSCLEEDKLRGRKDTMFVLDFLSRLTPATFTSREQEDLKPFLECLNNHLNCDSWAQRLLAAKCYRLLCTPTCSEMKRLLDIVTGNEHCSMNRMHAVLHLANLLAQDNPNLATDLGTIYESPLTSRFTSLVTQKHYLVCIEFLELIEYVLPQKESPWRHSLYKTFLEDTGESSSGCELPGKSMWKVACTRWLFRSNKDWLRENFLHIINAAERDEDVMEGVLEHLIAETARFELHSLECPWHQVAAKLVHYCSRAHTYRTLKIQALQVLQMLLEAESGFQESFLNNCCKICKDHAANKVPGGTTVQAQCLLLWAACIKHMLGMQDKRVLTDFLDELQHWSSVLDRFSQWNADEIFRLQAAHSLRILGQPLLIHLASCNPLPTSIIYSVFCSILSLLQDENEEARGHAAEIFHTEASSGHLIPVQPNVAIKKLFECLLSVCKGRDDLVVFLMGQLKSENPTDVEVIRLSRSDSNSLFEQEDINFYAEPLVIVALVKEHVQMAIKEVTDDNKGRLYHYFVQEGRTILNEAEKTLSLLKALRGNLSILAGHMFGENRLHLTLSMLHVRMCTCIFALKAQADVDVKAGNIVAEIESQKRKLQEMWTPQLPSQGDSAMTTLAEQ